MRTSQYLLSTLKETPADAEVISHQLMLRAGMIRKLASGLYTWLPTGVRVLKKVENIVREEMNNAGAIEVLMPVVQPSELWQESGRWEQYGPELLRIADRGDRPFVLGPTHEEVITDLIRNELSSYKQLPLNFYQIQTKFRDEGRPRGGLIRVREFTMKDAYSFHTSQEDLEKYYQECYDAYNRIFARAGIPEVITVKSDSGMMGGSISHEYMLLTPVGEDSIAVCSECDYRANMEAAQSIVENKADDVLEELKKEYTPNIHTIEDICEFLHSPLEKSCKAVVYQKNATDEYVVIFVRGDLDINETKLTNLLGEAVHPAVITEECGLHAGFIGPVGLPENMTVLFDNSLKGATNLSCGANEENHHYVGLNIPRDVGEVEYNDLAKIVDGGICPQCGKHTIKISRGIEVGNIFQLGTKYTKSMHMTYLDKEGNEQYPIMGCYGIGVGRLAASVCEVRHDDYGPIWPITIAPWQVHLCCLRSDDADAKALADKLYDEMQKDGIEVIYDDRNVRPGVMFSDADLLGCPVRVVVSPRNLAEGCCEVMTRTKSINEKVAVDDVIPQVKKMIKDMFDELNK